VIIWVLSSLAAAMPLDDDIARGFYLWETGRDAEATELAREIWLAHPDVPDAIELYAATQVAAGRGASLEAELRERLGRDTTDPLARVGLAWGLAYRHAKPGAWCDEAMSLVRSVQDDEAHAWATLAEREIEVRCKGTTDHADAELARLAADPDSPAWADGILARVESGYIRSELAEAASEVWDTAPEHLYRAAALWRDHVSGPSRRRARREAKQALAFAAESARPVWVWAALRAYRELGWEDEIAETEAHLARIDPGVDLELERDLHAITDPEAYAKIEECFDGDIESEIRACSAALESAETDAVRAYLHYRRFLALRAFDDFVPALDEAIAAFEADPTLLSYARSVVSVALDVEADVIDETRGESVARAMERLIANEPEVERAGSTVARRWARDLLLAARLTERSGDPSRAASLYLRSFGFDPSPARRLELGRALADSRQSASAVLHLTRGLVEAMEVPDLIRAARDRLDALAPQWGRGDANDILQEAIGAPGPDSPLQGEILEPDSWSWPADEGPSPTVRLVVLWGELFEESERRYAALKTVAQYASQHDDVSAFAVDVGIRKASFPEDIELAHRSSGPLPVQSLRIVTVPSVLVLDAEYRLRDVISPFEADDEADEALVEAVDAVRGTATD